MENKSNSFNLITLILIGLVIFLVLLVIVNSVLWKNDNLDISLVDSVEIENEEVNNSESKNLDIANNRYSEYKDLYDKYSDSNVTWYVKDCLNPEEDYVRGAYTKSVKIDSENELMIEDGKGYWIDSISGIQKEFLASLQNSVEEKIDFLIVPLEKPELEYVWCITENNTLYKCNNQVKYYSDYEYWSPFTFYNYIETRENFNKDYKIVDMCYIEEKISDFSDIYFLTTDGELINEYGEKYVKLTDEFYTLLDSANTVTQDYITIKYFYFNSKSYIHVKIDENEYGETPREFWYVECNEKIKEIYFSTNKNAYSSILIKDIYFLTESDTIYSYPLSYSYGEGVVSLMKLLNEVKEVDDSGMWFIITTKDGEKHSGDALIYADGE